MSVIDGAITRRSFFVGEITLVNFRAFLLWILLSYLSDEHRDKLYMYRHGLEGGKIIRRIQFRNYPRNGYRACRVISAEMLTSYFASFAPSCNRTVKR
jgi:hypothetical protein